MFGGFGVCSMFSRMKLEKELKMHSKPRVVSKKVFLELCRKNGIENPEEVYKTAKIILGSVRIGNETIKPR